MLLRISVKEYGTPLPIYSKDPPKSKNNPNPSPAEIRFGLFCFGMLEGTRYIMVSASSSRRRANVHRTFAFYGSSPKNKNNPNPSPAEVRFGLSCLGTPEGTRYIMVSASSSRRRANVHRTFAFYGSSPKEKIIRTLLLLR